MQNARDLPWRRNECSPWGVMVSEFMLQQTPVKRVLPVWEEWMRRWPTPADLAAEPTSEAVRAWGRLGYPRRAQRLHGAAVAIVERHGGEVPADHEALLALPGVGSYTAAAISVFAFGLRETVIDTNIRRVHARAVSGKALPSRSLTAAETRLAEALMPADTPTSCLWNAATMELGALVCTAKSPTCQLCPVEDLCAWVAAGRPEAEYTPKGQAWHGTDRQVRGAVMAVLRAAHEPVDRSIILDAGAASTTGATVSPDLAFPADIPVEVRRPLKTLYALSPAAEQLQRCYAGLLADSLAREVTQGDGSTRLALVPTTGGPLEAHTSIETPEGRYRITGTTPQAFIALKLSGLEPSRYPDPHEPQKREPQKTHPPSQAPSRNPEPAPSSVARRRRTSRSRPRPQRPQ